MGRKGKYLWPPLNWHLWSHWEWNEAYSRLLWGPSGFPFLGWDRPGFPSSNSSAPSRGKHLISLDTNDGFHMNYAHHSNFIFSHCWVIVPQLQLLFLPLGNGVTVQVSTFLTVVGTWCSFQRKHCERSVLLRACEEGCAERRRCSGWSKGSDADLVDASTACVSRWQLKTWPFHSDHSYRLTLVDVLFYHG